MEHSIAMKCFRVLFVFVIADYMKERGNGI